MTLDITYDLGEKHMVISIDIDTAFDKPQHLFMIKYIYIYLKY